MMKNRKGSTMATKRRKVKVAKAMPIQTAARTEKRLLHLRAPGGVHTYRDVQRALKSIARFAGGNPRHNKMLAYTVLEYFGVHRLAELPHGVREHLVVARITAGKPRNR